MLHDSIDKREELEEDFESFTTGFSAAVVKFALDELSEKWEYVVTAKRCFIDSRQAGDEAEALEVETYVARYEEERRRTASLKRKLQQAVVLQHAAAPSTRAW